MNYLLIITLVLLFVGFVIGWAKGLIGILTGILSWVIILGVMYVATPAIERAYSKGPVYEKMYNTVSDHVSNGLVTKENKAIDELNESIEAANDSDSTDTTTETASDGNQKADINLSDSESMKDFLSGISISLPSAVTRIVAQAVDGATNAAARLVSNITADSQDKITSANDTIVNTVSTPIATLMVRGLALLTSFLLAVIITRIIALIGQALGNTPVIGGISRFFGGIWGIIVVLVLVWLFMDLVTCFSITPNGQKLMSQINSSSFLDTLYINNPLTFFITK
ncbi:MAG: hypothetical protein PUG04_03850 [Lachnospiraceae bacterium]|nr:hypothetical protein [Lachnospiraceae bacterium]